MTNAAEGQELAAKLTAIKRAQFLQDAQKSELEVRRLLAEFHEKIIAILLRHADADGIIPKGNRGKINLELRNTSVWLAAELETILREGIEKAAQHGLDAENQAQKIYIAKALSHLPEGERQRILERLGNWQRKKRQKENNKEG